MYYAGQGVPQDYAEAVKWFRKAAEQGNAAAQSDLGFMYAKGWGVPWDHTEAMKWYRLAADQGNVRAQYRLGGMYADGLFVSQDFVQAHMWLSLAASGLSDAEDRDPAVGDRDRVAKQMAPNQIAEAQRLAREWLAAHPKP